MARAPYVDSDGNWVYPDENDPTPDPSPSSSSSGGNGGGQEYPGAMADRQGAGGAQEAQNRSTREQQARDLNAKLGVDGGNLESFLSGRNTYEGYLKDQTARTTNIPGGTEPPNPYSPPARVGGAGGAAASAGGGGAASPSGTGNSQLDQLINQLMANNSQSMTWAAEDRAKQKDYSDKVRGHITTALNDAKAPVSETDPLIAKQAQVADFGNQRTLQQSREAMAARSAAGGGFTSGAEDAALQSGTENLGISRNSLVSRLMADEVDKRRANAQHLIDTESGVMTGDETIAANRDLAAQGNLVSTLRNRADDLTANKGLDIQKLLGEGSLSNQLLGIQNQFTLGNRGLDLTGRSISNQNRQFYDTLGYTGAHDAATLNYLYAQLAGAA